MTPGYENRDRGIPAPGRGGKGKADGHVRHGRLVGALIVDDDKRERMPSLPAVAIRTAARQVRARDGDRVLWLMNLGEGDTLLAIARNAEESGDDNAVAPMQTRRVPGEGTKNRTKTRA